MSILYADIVNFTPLSETLSAHHLVSTLNRLFGRFDQLAQVQGVPWNMTVEKRFRSHLWFLDSFETFSSQPFFHCLILKTNTKQFSYFWDFKNAVWLFLKVVFDFWIYLRHSVINLFSLYDCYNKPHKILIVLGFPKCSLPFLCCQYYRRYWEFGSDLANFIFIVSRIIHVIESRLTTEPHK